MGSAIICYVEPQRTWCRVNSGHGPGFKPAQCYAMAVHETLSDRQKRNISCVGVVQFQMEGKFLFMWKKMLS